MFANLSPPRTTKLYGGEIARVFDVGRLAPDRSTTLDVFAVLRPGGALCWWQRRDDGRSPGELTREDAAIVARVAFGAVRLA